MKGLIQIAARVASVVLALSLIPSCGDDDTGVQVGPLPPGVPTVFVSSVPTSVRLGELITFSVEVRATRGIRSTSFLSVTIREPDGDRSSDFFDPSSFPNCSSGSTLCRSDEFAFRIGADNDAGSYQITFVAFDSANQASAPRTVTVFAFR